jgi:hypothetical protein
MVYTEIMAACHYFKLKHSTRLFFIIKTILVFIIAKYFGPKEAPSRDKIQKYYVLKLN